jgi:hypothetical protein
MIKPETVRSTKEQADIALTVLAMDYLHTGVGQFFLVTGDQDFIPLISRLRRDGRKVTVVYGDPGKLSGELRQILTTPGLDSVDIAEVTTLRDRKTDTGCRSLLGMLELQRRGYILGGREKGERTTLLAQWAVIENDDESQYWSLVDTVAEKVLRIDAAFPGKGGEWLPKSATRTYLRLTPEHLADIDAADHVIRRLSSRPRGLTIGSLRTGPFRVDNGTLLDRVLDGLLVIGLMRREADGTFSLVGQPLQLGYLEQLWRVYAGLTAECYRRSAASIPFGQLESLLGRRGIGQGPGTDQRAASRIKEAIAYAKAAGAIDVVAVGGRRHAMAPDNALSRLFEHAYHSLYAAFSGRLGDAVTEGEVFTRMEADDDARTVPLFGYDMRDRQRLLRILAQSQLVMWRDRHVTIAKSGWGDAGLALRR